MITGQEVFYALVGAAVTLVLAAVALAVYEVTTVAPTERPTRLMTAAVGLLIAGFVALSAVLMLANALAKSP